MNENMGTLQRIAEHLAQAIAPLKWATANLDQFRIFMHRLGWEIESLPAAYTELGNRAFETFNVMEALGDEPVLAEVLAVIDKVSSINRAIRSLKDQDPPDGVDRDTFQTEIGETLFEYLFVQYILAAFPSVYTTLEMLGIIENEVSISTKVRPGYVRSRLNYRKISEILADPLSIPREVYGFGSVDFDFSRLSGHLMELFHTLGMLSSLGMVPSSLSEGFQQGDTREQIPRDDIQKSLDFMVSVGLFDADISGKLERVGFAILEFPGEGEHFPGIIIQPLLPTDIGAEVSVGRHLSLQVRCSNNLKKTFGIALRPGDLWIRFPSEQDELLTSFDPISCDLSLKVIYAPETPSILFGQPGKTRLQLQGSSLGLDLKYLQPQFELCIYAATKELAFVLSPGDLGGFLSKLVGNSEVAVAIPFSLAWSSSTGLTFGGSPGFSVATAPHLTLRPLTIDRFAIGIQSSFGDDRSTDLSLAIAVDLSARLGPVTASAEGIGLKLALVFPDHDVFDVNFGYQAPTGIGIAIDAKGITGGGLLSFDHANQRYAGYLGLNFGDLGLSAVGLIVTKLPDGSEGFALLVSIGVTFAPPIQLAMGFTLMGVGGLVGVNRSISVDELRTGFRSRSLEAVLFPEPSTVIANASSIIGGLEKVFPTAEGQYLVGPIVKLGWGSPPIIRAEVGVFMAFPDPVTIVLLGQVKAAFPKEDKALVLINLDVLGVIDFAREELTFQASLYESHILAFKLTGDSAFLLGWGNDPRFALSMGGFHPAFTVPSPPVVFAGLKRLSLSISSGNGLDMKCQAYQALTPNSLQFGARVDLYVSAAGFTVKGYLGFDALFCYSPFSFEVAICGGVHVAFKGISLFGVDLNLVLSGPSPWHARGTLRIKILFLSIPLWFNESWGSADRVYLPSIDPWPLMFEALCRPTAWGSALPRGQAMVEHLCAGEGQNSLLFWAGSIKDLPAILGKIRTAADPVSEFVWGAFEQSLRDILSDPYSTQAQILDALVKGLNQILRGNSFYDAERFAKVILRSETQSLIAQNPTDESLIRFNRLLLEDTYPHEIRRIQQLLLHPLGRLEVRQNILPFGVQLQKVGNSPIIAHDRFEIVSMTVGDQTLDEDGIESLQEFFPRGQYQELKSDEKLSLPSFEKMPAGVAVTSNQTLVSAQLKTIQAGYKPITLDDDGSSDMPAFVGVDWDWAGITVAASSARIATRRAGTRGLYTPLRQQPAVSFQEERYYIARAADLTQAEVAAELPWGNIGLTRMVADQLLKAQLQLHPEQAGELIIVPAYEIAA